MQGIAGGGASAPRIEAGPSNANTSSNQIQNQAGDEASMLKGASDLLEEQVKSDNNTSPNYGSLLNAVSTTSAWGQIAPPTTSSSYVSGPNGRWSPFARQRISNLPSSLMDQYTGNEMHVTLGLFAEIGRAWIVNENRLYLWDYAGNSDANSVVSYEELGDRIIAVGLVPPKASVFVDAVTHVLVLCTNLVIRLVGLSVSKSAASQHLAARTVTMYETERQAPTDGVTVRSVASSPDGRIFLAGIGGSLHELEYYLNAGMFSGNCRLVTHDGHASGWLVSWIKGGPPAAQNAVKLAPLLTVDGSRALLYKCTNGESIEIFKIEQRGLTKLYLIKDVPREGQAAWGRTWQNVPHIGTFKVISLQALTENDGGGAFGLVATTTMGARLFFSVPNSHPSGASGTFRLTHVRAPPLASSTHEGRTYFNAPTGAATSHQQFNVSCAQTAPGGFFLAADYKRSEQTDRSLFVSVPHIGLSLAAVRSRSGGAQNESALVETFDWLQVENLVHAIAEVGQDLSGRRSGLSELPTSGSGSRREFVVLTAQAAITFVRNRPVDSLVSILQTAGANSVDAKSFVDEFGPTETAAMCLAIASGNALDSVPGTLSASRMSLSPRQAPAELSSQAKQLFYVCTNIPERSSFGSAGQRLGIPTALALYISRLVHPIWDKLVTRGAPSVIPGGRPGLVGAVHETTLMSVSRDLASLNSFLDSEPSLYAQPLPQWSQREGYSNLVNQQAAMAALRVLLIQAVESLSFALLLLVDIRLSEILPSCSDDLVNALSRLTFKALFSTRDGRDVARQLVNVVISYQIARGASVDAISDTLEQRCGSICSTDDILLYKADEALGRARDAPNDHQRQNLLRESLHLYSKAYGHLADDKLRDVCQSYRELLHLQGAVELPLICAKLWDADRASLAWRQEGCPPNDPRQLVAARVEKCYDHVLAALSEADHALDGAYNGRITRPIETADELRSQAYATVIASDDQQAHFRLYAWLIDERRWDQFLEIRSPFVETYLLSPPRSQERLDLLWQYFARAGQYANAARVLFELADSTTFNINLHKRLEYLSLAANHARSSLSTAQHRNEMVEFLSMTDDKLEVAQLQVEVARTVEQAENIEMSVRQRLLSSLDAKLYDVTELYRDFAEPRQMLEVMLLIFFVSDHRDRDHISDIWRKVLTNASQADESFRPSRSKIVELGQRFYPSENIFPIDELVHLLESKNLAQADHSDSGWVVDTFREAGVPYDVLYQVYETLYNSTATPWEGRQSKAYLLGRMVHLLESWQAEFGARPTNTPSIHRRSIGDLLKAWKARLREHQSQR